MVRIRSRSLSFAVACALCSASNLACSSSSSDSGAAAGTNASTAGAGSSNGAAGRGSSVGGVGAGGTANASGGAGNSSAGSAGASLGGTNAGGADGDSGTSGSAGSSSGGGANTGGAGVTWNEVFVTWYGYDDNSCATEAQHTCANIAYGMSDGYPTKHDSATEGKGTYDDPITFAASQQGDPESFGGATIEPGTIIYYPKVKKYFVMEDSCLECSQQWGASKLLHVDLWMGPSTPPQGQTMFGQPLIDCEDNSTDSSANDPTDTIIVDPPANLEVNHTMLFTGTQCNVPQ